MTESVSPVSGWESFYVIVGSSGAALIGLQFVVIVLIAESRMHSTPDSIGAFGTPTVVHFASALLTSAIMCAPWSSLSSVCIALTLAALIGFSFVARAIARTRGQVEYKPVWEDWLWHMIFPLATYATLLVAALLLPSHAAQALFFIGGAALGLLFIGIHNAWDTVTYIVVERMSAAPDESK